MEPQHIVETEPLRDAFAAQGILAARRSSGICARNLLAAANGLF